MQLCRSSVTQTVEHSCLYWLHRSLQLLPRVRRGCALVKQALDATVPEPSGERREDHYTASSSHRCLPVVSPWRPDRAGPRLLSA